MSRVSSYGPSAVYRPAKKTSAWRGSRHGSGLTSANAPRTSGGSKQSPTTRPPRPSTTQAPTATRPATTTTAASRASRIDPASDAPEHDGAVLAIEVVVRLRRRPVEVLAARPRGDLEADRPVEADRDAVAGPGDGLDLRPAVGASVVEEPLVQRAAQPLAPEVGVRRDHVTVGGVRVVRR